MFKKIKSATDFLKNVDFRKEYDKEEKIKRRKEQFEQERKATSSLNRKQFIDQLYAREKAAEENFKKDATERKARKRKAREKLIAQEEGRHARDSVIERLSREAGELLESKLREEKNQNKEEEKTQNHTMNFNMTVEEFAEFERDILDL